ncbi:MAG: hypothetical protein CVV27_12835, partial [Candidatus Melainabacteria bacterium HGW-Melainabacteria-1]
MKLRLPPSLSYSIRRYAAKCLPLALAAGLLCANLPVFSAPVKPVQNSPQKILKPAAPLPVDRMNLYLTQNRPAELDVLSKLMPGVSISYTPDKGNWQQAVLRYDTQTVVLHRERRPDLIRAQQQSLKQLLSRLDPNGRLGVTSEISGKADLIKEVISARSSDPDDPKWAELVSGMAQLWHGLLGYREELLDPRLRVLLARASDYEEN